jgi:hypothetical protein
LKKGIKKLEQILAKDLLDRELEATSVDTLANAWKIGERTVQKLYSSGYRTLKDLDNNYLLRYSKFEYIGNVRSNSIKRWIERDKKQRKNRIRNEIEKGSHSNTEIGQRIEEVKVELGRCMDKIEEISKILSFSKRDFRRYRNISFANFLLGKEIKIRFEKIISPELKSVEDLLQEILNINPIAKEKMREFYKEFLLMKKEYSHGYKGFIMKDGIYPYNHFLLIHAIGISFPNQNYIETIYFKEIEHCSKFENKILLLLKEKKRESIEFVRDALIAYKYIKTLKKI